MRAKKEFYLSYLKDNDNYKISRSKTIYFRKSSSLDSNHHKSSNKKNLSSKNINKIKGKNKIKYKNNKNCSFEDFVEEIKNYDYNQITKWDNEARKYTINIDTNSNKVKLTELTQINYTNPLLILNKEYTKENYQKILFESEIASIENTLKINQNKNINIINSNDIFENQTFFIEKILEKREQLELNKKILNYYLQYYCRNNAEMMNPSMSKIRELTNIIDFYYDKIHSNKKEILVMKNSNIDNTIKLILKKKKIENLSVLYSILKNKIFPCYKDIKKLKLKKMNYNFIKYYEENIRFINEVALIEKYIVNEINQNNIINNKLIKFNVIEEIKKKLLRKKEKLNKIYNYEKNNLFDSKKSYIAHLYYIFTKEHNTQNKENDKEDNNNQSSLFVTEIQKIYKLKLKKIILETIQYYRNKKNQNSNEVVIFNLKKPRLSEINNIILEENTLITCFKNIFTKLKNLVDIFLYYYNLITSNEKNNDFNDENFKSEIKSRKNEFYEILDKNLSKLIRLFNNSNENREEEFKISKKNLLFLINLICLFEKMIKIKFNVKYNKYLNLALKDSIINQIKLENKKVIDKAMVLLPNDIWEKNTLDPSFFNIESMQERIPFYFRKFISFFNESEIKESLTSKLVNKDNIEDIFNYLNNNENFSNNSSNNDINFDKVINLYINKINKNEIEKLQKDLEDDKKPIMFNKPLKYNSAFVNNSSCCILRGIEDQIINLVIFDSLTYEIFSELFDTIDLYIFICFKMFMKKSKNLSPILKNLNYKEIQKDSGNMEYWSDTISNQKKYMMLKKFCITMEKKFCEFFGNNKEFISEEEKQSFIDKLIPKLNEVFLFINEEEKELKHNFTNNGNSYKNIYTYKKSYSCKDIKVNININNLTENYNEKKEEEKNSDDLDEDGIEALNINQMNENSSTNTNSKSSSTIKDKNEGMNFFNFFRNIYGTEQNNSKEIPIENLIKDIKIKVTSLHIKQIIILVSCILTLKKVLKRLVDNTTKIELEDQRYLILNKINKYEKLIEQMRTFFYMNISSEILDFSNILYLIEEYNWAPTPEEGSTQLFEASQWVKKLESLFEVIVCEIHNKFNKLFGEKKLAQFFVDLIKYIINSVQESFARIKNCNDMGRSIMLKDIKLLKEGIENTLKKYNYNKNIKINSLFDVIIQYANAWYYTSDELSKFIFNYSIQYKYFESLLSTSPTISELTNDAKNEFVNTIKQKYLSQFKKVISNINSDN